MKMQKSAIQIPLSVSSQLGIVFIKSHLIFLRRKMGEVQSTEKQLDVPYRK